MESQVNRQTVDLSGFPELVVIYLGMRVNAWFGLKTLIGFGPRIQAAVGARPVDLQRDGTPPLQKHSPPGSASA